MIVLYIAALTTSLVCMVLLDVRFRLFFWRDARRATLIMVIGVLFFTVWDAAAIGAGIFIKGDSPLLLGIELAPEFPLEELFFLCLLCYVTMNIFGALDRISTARRSRVSDAAPEGRTK